MRIKIFLKKLITIGVAVLLAVTSVGCFDLGDFKDEEAYYSAFGDVRLVYQNPNVVEKDVKYKDYSIKDYFYNKNTGEDFTYGDPKDDDPDEGKDIPQIAYTYMAIPVKRAMKLDSLALYMNATESGSMQIFLYLVDELPDNGSFSNIRLLGDPEYQQKQDAEGNPMFDADGNPIYQEKLDANNNPVYDENGNVVYQSIAYSDPDESKMIAKVTVHLRQNTWNSFTASGWTGGSTVEVKESQYILLRFTNNGGASSGDKLPISFRTTNLLIRALS